MTRWENMRTQHCFRNKVQLVPTGSVTGKEKWLHDWTTTHPCAHKHPHTHTQCFWPRLKCFQNRVRVFASASWSSLPAQHLQPITTHPALKASRGWSQSQLPFKQLYFQAKPGRHVVLLLRQILICLSVWLTKKKNPDKIRPSAVVGSASHRSSGSR